MENASKSAEENAVESQLEAAVNDFESEFKASVIIHEKIAGFYRDDILRVTFCPRFPARGYDAVRTWLEKRNVTFLAYSGPCNNTVYCAAPLLAVSLQKAYHVTTRKSWESSIQKDGLLPGSRADGRFTSDRLDCEGNIYVCSDLGESADRQKERCGSAYWWLGQKSGSDSDCVILKVNLADFDDLLMYRDVLSYSGIIVRGVTSIPANRIEICSE